MLFALLPSFHNSGQGIPTAGPQPQADHQRAGSEAANARLRAAADAAQVQEDGAAGTGTRTEATRTADKRDSESERHAGRAGS